MANANRSTNSRSTLETDEIDFHGTTSRMQLDNRHRTTASGRSTVRGVTVTDGAPPKTLHGHINTDTGFIGNTDEFLYEKGGPMPFQGSLQCWQPNQSWASYTTIEGESLPAGREGGVNRPSSQRNTTETAESQSSAAQSTATEVPQFQVQSFENTPEIPLTTFTPNFSIDDLQGADLYAPPPTQTLNPSSGECFPNFVMEQMLSSSSSDSYHSFSPSSFSLYDSVPPGADVQTHPMDYEWLEERMVTDIASIQLDDSEQAANQHEEIYDHDQEMTESANQLRRLFQQNDDGDT